MLPLLANKDEYIKSPSCCQQRTELPHLTPAAEYKHTFHS